MTRPRLHFITRLHLAKGVVGRLVIATLVTGLLTGLAGALLVRTFETSDLRAEATARNTATAQRLAAILDSEVGGLIDQLSLLAAVPSVTALSEDAGVELAVALRVSTAFDRLVLYHADGRPAAAAASAALIDASSVAPRDRAPGRTWVELRTEGRLPALELGVEVRSPTGEARGSLVGEVPIDLLAQEAEARIPANDVTAFVTTDDGVIVAHRERDRVLARERFDVAELPEGQGGIVPGEDGSRVVAAARSAATGVWVVVEQPESVALAPVEDAIDEVTAVFVAVIIATVLAIILVARRLLRPLVPLAEAVGRLEEGQLATRVDVDAVGEVAVLADGFNRMASSLEERDFALQRAERMARLSEQRLRLLVEGVEDYAIVLLDTTGVIRSWNSGARRLFACDADHAVGRHLLAFTDADDPPADPFEANTSSGRGESEGWFERADGTRFWGHVVVAAIQDEDETPHGFAAVVHDLTERHAAERALEAALRREQEAAGELRRANQIKDEFLAVAAHELQTPLAAILGASDLLEDPEIGPEERQRLRTVVSDHAGDMRLIVDRLLEFARLQTGKVRLVERAVDLLVELERAVEVADGELGDHPVSVEADNVAVRVDPMALGHIVTNLLSNAAKFSPAGTPITVRGAVRGDVLQIEVEDQGVGIDPSEHETIFELFRQSAHDMASSRGTGVGLAIVRRYVELLGGEVRVDSSRGAGATFVVLLPVAARPVPTG